MDDLRPAFEIPLAVTTLREFIDAVFLHVNRAVRDAAIDEDQRQLMMRVVAGHQTKIVTPSSDPTALFFFVARAWRPCVDDSGIQLGAFCLLAFLSIDLFDDVQDDDLAGSPFSELGALGPPIAINTALTLFAMASHELNRILADEPSTVVRRRLAAEYERMTLLSSRGQHRDLFSGTRSPTPTEVLALQRDKAALIVFIAVAGAIYAGVSAEMVERYRRAAESLCVLIQILDDLRDVFGKSRSPDLSTGKMSFPLAAFHACASPSAREEFNEAVKALPTTLPRIQQLWYDQGAVARSAAVVEQLRQALHAEIAATGNGAAHADLLNLVDGLASGLYRLPATPPSDFVAVAVTTVAAATGTVTAAANIAAEAGASGSGIDESRVGPSLA